MDKVFGDSLHAFGCFRGDFASAVLVFIPLSKLPCIFLMKLHVPRGNAAWKRHLGSSVQGCTWLPTRPSAAYNRFHLENTAARAGIKTNTAEAKSDSNTPIPSV